MARPSARRSAVSKDSARRCLISGVLFGLLQLRQVVHFIDLGIVGAALHAEAHEALGLHGLEQVDVFALAVGHHRRHDHQLGALGHGQHGIDHLRYRLRGQRVVRVVDAVRGADARVQQAQVVVDLGHGAHGRTRVVRGGLLLDGDRRRQAFDHVHVRLFHQLQELARIGRQRLDIAALALRVQGVERQRRLAGAGQAGDHDQLVAWQVEVDVFQVVRTRTADADFFHV
jgi:hypothetical protein